MNERKFELIGLAYDAKSLEPVISEKTMMFHHGKHLQTYVNNLNGLIAGTKYENSSLEDIVKTAEGAMLNNAGQVLNHNMYFEQFAAAGKKDTPTGTLATAIEGQFGSIEQFKDEFVKAGASLFGSGWVWLAADKNGKLTISQEPNAANPIQKGLCPIMTFDVWEHAYYLDYQNRRPDYLTALWDIVDWNVVEKRYEAATEK